MISRYQIDCEWEQNGYVQGALFPSHLKKLRANMENYNAVGARTRIVDPDEARDITGSSRFYGGWLHKEAGGMNAQATRLGAGGEGDLYHWRLHRCGMAESRSNVQDHAGFRGSHAAAFCRIPSRRFAQAHHDPRRAGRYLRLQI
jgi:hypothetical protein